MTLAMVLIGGALGAVCRFLVDRMVTRRRHGSLPWGTFTVNVAGSLLLGLLAGAGAGFGADADVPSWLGALVGTGFCGALTTYSTFGYETVRLAGSRPAVNVGRDGRVLALLNVGFTLAVGLGAAALGWWLAAAIF